MRNVHRTVELYLLSHDPSIALLTLYSAEYCALLSALHTRNSQDEKWHTWQSNEIAIRAVVRNNKMLIEQRLETRELNF